MSRARRARGFTLVEMLVAVLLLGVLTALGYGAYRAARISAERTEEALARTREIEYGMRVLVMDFAQMVPRPVRDPLGQSRYPSLRGVGGTGTLSDPSAGAVPGNGLGGSSGLGGGSSLGGSSFGGSSFGGSSLTFGSSSAFAGPGTSGGGDQPTPVPLFEMTRGGWSNTAGQQRGTLQRVSYALVGDVLKRAYTTVLDTVQSTQPVVQDLLKQVKAVRVRYLDANQVWQAQWPPPLIALPEALWTRPVAVEITIEFKDWGIVRRLVEVAG